MCVCVRVCIHTYTYVFKCPGRVSAVHVPAGGATAAPTHLIPLASHPPLPASQEPANTCASPFPRPFSYHCRPLCHFMASCKSQELNPPRNSPHGKHAKTTGSWCTDGPAALPSSLGSSEHWFRSISHGIKPLLASGAAALKTQLYGLSSVPYLTSPCPCQCLPSTPK